MLICTLVFASAKNRFSHDPRPSITINHLLSFSLYFRYKVPDRRNLIKGLEKKKMQIEEKIKADLQHCHDVAITHDGWTSCNTESYSTVTGHYIDQDWNLKSVSLCTEKVIGSHTSENIASHLQKVKDEWNLPSCVAVTDNAANEKKAFEILNWTRFGCYGHRVNLAVRNSLSETNVSRLVGKGRKLVSFFHHTSNVNDILMEKQLLLGDETNLKLIMDVVTRWNSTYSMLERINKLVPAIVATANDSRVNKAAATSVKNFTFSYEEQTISEKLVELLEPFQNATESISSESTPTLHKIMPILLAIEKAVTVKDDDGGAIVAVKQKMGQEMEKRMQDTELALLACILNPFTKHLRFLGAGYRTRAIDLLETAAMDMHHELDGHPTLKIKQEKKERVSQTETVHDDQPQPLIPEPPLPKIPSILQEDDHDVQEGDHDEQVLPDIPHKKMKIENEMSKSSHKKSHMDDWLQDVICVGETVEPTVDLIKHEVSRYLGSGISIKDKDLSILEWWKKNELFFPRLSILAKKYLCIPASSTPSERIFSLCGTLVSKKRSRLSPSKVGLLVFLNKNLNGFW